MGRGSRAERTPSSVSIERGPRVVSLGANSFEHTLSWRGARRVDVSPQHDACDVEPARTNTAIGQRPPRRTPKYFYIVPLTGFRRADNREASASVTPFVSVPRSSCSLRLRGRSEDRGQLHRLPTAQLPSASWSPAVTWQHFHFAAFWLVIIIILRREQHHDSDTFTFAFFAFAYLSRQAEEKSIILPLVSRNSTTEKKNSERAFPGGSRPPAGGSSTQHFSPAVILASDSPRMTGNSAGWRRLEVFPPARTTEKSAGWRRLELLSYFSRG